jgi:hypothetical protein
MLLSGDIGFILSCIRRIRDTTEYDRIIRTYIPHYGEIRGVQLDRWLITIIRRVTIDEAGVAGKFGV